MDEYLSYYAELAHALGRAEPEHPVLDERRTVLIILISSYVEAVINLYFTFAFDESELKAIDRRPILEKWAEVPARRIPSYRLDRTGELFRALATLVDCRNSIAHMRPEFSVGEKTIHAGNSQPLEQVTHTSIMRWIRLPLELVDNIRAQDKSDAGDSLQSTSDAWDASQGWDDRLKFYKERYAQGRGEQRFTAW